ncbi:L,D-peptidoglycan transpeptidase YkuD, ErfK/YbiS/YcfS/YnhG family [Kaistia soli DSM 19436]|uniref:L,D-peptidoglycan transpeptidase YkuD, ErfK/YbiS/YcfS/YnhG family n=2 Tax=Kaistia TaxID=166953 RepID=A0A1M5CUY9_9HYPH|nr:L,D-peptidoglycan transpeptidase YkuD, ErfK/YbiS/YcfS/YnhG family [Kaistia soli DSM 19436]
MWQNRNGQSLTATVTPRKQGAPGPGRGALGKRSTRLELNRRPGTTSQGILIMSGRTIPCAIGRSGISLRKREGDGATPVARMAFVAVLWRADRVAPPATLLPRRAIRPEDGWCDAAFDPNYNRLIRRPYRKSHEAMSRDDALYDIVVVLDWNCTRRLQGRGSAIFLHLARPGYKPTEGCVAVSIADMRWLLAQAGRRAHLQVRT